jgi:phosphoserine phosphatase RsbX
VRPIGACVCSELAWPAVLERGEAGEPLAGEDRSGDLAVWVPYEGGALVATLDGLGHGRAAADASEAAAEQFRRYAGEPPETMLRHCHQALRSTRGVVATVAWFDLETAGLSWTGVGNVEGRLVRAGRARGDSVDSPTLFGGVLGWSLPSVRVLRTTLAPGDCVVMATDGVAADFGSSLVPGASAQEQARRVLASHSRGSDDALVVAVRWCPEGSAAPSACKPLTR